jgi:predicted Zn-dependent peptidase
MAPLKDRLIFDTRVLPNGITIYHKPMDVPFASMRIVLPIGHAHNTGHIPNGAAHFLEHMACRKCAAFPELNAMDRRIALNGGSLPASTSMRNTSYTAMVPATHSEEGFRALLSRVFEPIFDEEGLEQERAVISSERRMQSKWHPANNEIEHYIDTQWRDLGFTSLRQDVGEDADLAAITLPILQSVHQAYFSTRTYVISGGQCDVDLMERELSAIETHMVELPENAPAFRWIRREYHERSFDEEQRFTYRIAGLFPSGDLRASVAMRTLQSLLIHPVQGVLHDWLRNELGWSYEVRFHYGGGDPHGPSDWLFAAPVNNREQAAEVRAGLRKRVESALDDKDLIASEVRRLIMVSVFDMQTLFNALSYAGASLRQFQRIPSETELEEVLQSLRDGTYLRFLYERYWAPQMTGEFLSTPL